MQNEQWMPVGEVFDFIEKYGRPPIREFKARKKWSERNLRRSQPNSIIAFYNSGHRLYIDPEFLPAHSCYRQPLQWLRYRDYLKPAYIRASNNKIAGFLDDLVCIQHRGHDKAWRCVKIDVGTRYYGNIRGRAFSHTFLIPPLCIQYVAVFRGEVKDSLLVCQPLKLETFMTGLSMMPFTFPPILASRPPRVT